MPERPLPPEFDHLFRPEKMRPEDPTLKIPQVRHDTDTQEIRGSTLQLPAVTATTRQPVAIQEPSGGYIPLRSHKESEHTVGAQPSNALLGIAFSLAIGIFAAAFLVRNFTLDTPSEEPPRAEQTTAAPTPSASQTSPAKKRISPTTMPASAHPWPATPRPLESTTSVPATPTSPSIVSASATTVAPTASTAPPPIEPTAPEEPPSDTPVATPTDTSVTATPSDQPSAQSTAPTP